MTAALLALVLATSAVHVDPAVITLGKGQASAQIDVLALGPGDAPLPNAKVTVTASVGDVSPVQPVGGGRFHATYRPPKEHYPLVALIEVQIEAKGKVTRQWASLPVRAGAVLKIETKRHATVNVDVGPLKYGPVRANGHGKVRLHAVVPPGVASATVHSVDDAGNSTDKEIPLHPRPYPRVRAALSRAVASWIDRDPVEIEVFAVEPSGKPIDDPAKLRCQADQGEIGTPVKKAPGVFLFPYRAPGVLKAPQDRIRVGPVDGDAAELQLNLRPGPAVKIAVALEPKTYLAGSGTPVRVITTVVDAKGNRLAGAHPTLSVDFGRLVDSTGATTLTLPDAFSGHSQVVVRAAAGSSTGEAVVSLKPAPASKAELALIQQLVHAGRTLRGTLRLHDRFGNPADDDQVVVAALGRSAHLTPAPGGGYQVELASEKADAPGLTRLEVSEQQAPLTSADFGLLEYQRPWGFSLGLALVGQSNLKHATAGVPRLELGLRLGHSEAQLIVQLEGRAYAQFQEQVSGVDETGKITGTAGAIGVRYSVPLGVRVAWQTSLVVGTLRTKSELSLTASPTVKQTETLPTGLIRPATGLSWRAGPGRLFTELQYEYSPAKGQLTGNLGGVGFAGGYLISF